MANKKIVYLADRKPKHTKESAKWAKVLHDFWPKEYDENGDKLKGGK